MTDFALTIAKLGYGIESDTKQYDSSRKRLQIDLTHNPKHLDNIVIDHKGTAYADFGVNNYKETLFQLEHGYGFAPFAFAFFYVDAVDFSTAGAPFPVVGRYANNLFNFEPDNMQDYLTIEVDQQYFKIVHITNTFGADSGEVSKVNQYRFKIKYYISSFESAAGAPPS